MSDDLKKGIRDRILEYFEANPDEELTRADMAMKFGANQRTVDNILYRLRQQGALESAHVWRLTSRGRHE